MTETPPSLADAREQFLLLVSDVRPELHRYCARLTGSVIEGEDIVQETLAKGFYALSLLVDVPPLRPWLFRIAHNAALDFLKSHARKYVEPVADLDQIVSFDETPDPAVVRAALACTCRRCWSFWAWPRSSTTRRTTACVRSDRFVA